MGMTGGTPSSFLLFIAIGMEIYDCAAKDLALR